MDSFFGWTATALTAYLAGCDLLENDISASNGTDSLRQGGSGDESGVFSSSTNAQSFGRNTYLVLASPPLPGGFPVSPPCSPIKRSARHQHSTSQFRSTTLLSPLNSLIVGSPKRRKVSEEVYIPGPPPTETRGGGHGNANSFEDLEARAKDDLSHRVLSIPVAPVSHRESSLSIISSSTEVTRPDVQVVYPAIHSTSASVVDATSDRGQPWLPVAYNVVIGRKRSAPVEFDDEVSLPHHKKYITGWMSEYIRLRARSWREMLRVMQEARWRPFRPQVIRYLAPAPASAPSTALRHGCTNPATGDLPVRTLTAFSTPQAETISPSPPPPSSDDPFPLLPATTTPPYSPPESPSPYTPSSSPHPGVGAVTTSDSPTPPSSIAYSFAWSVQNRTDSFLSASQISWADSGKWRADASPEQVACRLDLIVTEDPIPTATDLPPSLFFFSPFPASSLPPPLPNTPPSSITPTTSYPRYSPPPSASLPPTLPPFPLALSPALTPPASQSTGISRATVPTPKLLKVIKQDPCFEATRPNLYKMDYLRLRSKVKWRLKGLGFEKRLAPLPPQTPAVPTQLDEVVPLLVRIGSIPALLWPASVFNTPPAPVVPTSRRNNLDDSTTLLVLASLDFPKRAYRPRRRKRLISDDPVPMEEVELSSRPP